MFADTGESFTGSRKPGRAQRRPAVVEEKPETGATGMCKIVGKVNRGLRKNRMLKGNRSNPVPTDYSTGPV
jgi:hypothetical protein